MEGKQLNIARPKSCNTRKKMKKSEDAPEDRLSTLPEEMLCHILSFLDMREVLQTAFISRRWRHVWKYVQDLNLDYSLWNQLGKKKNNVRPYANKDYNKDACMAFLDRVLYFRDKSTDIRKLNLSRIYCSDVSRVNTWLNVALKLHVKEVCLEIPYSKPYLLCCSLFDSDIEVFKLKGTYAFCPIRLPNSICSARQLRILELESVQLPDPDSNGELHLSYPVLESLIFKGRDHSHIKVLNITAPQLKKLVVELPYVLRNQCKLKICSPHLKFLRLCDCSDAAYSGGELASLVSAQIGEYNRKLESQWLITNLERLRNVSTLQLLGSHKASPESMNMVYQLLNQFSNLKCLKLFGMYTGSCIQLVANYLKSNPCVETLVLRIHQGHSSEESEKDWEKEMSLQDSLDHLKYVRVEDIQCGGHELQILAFILKTAVVLEKVAVTYSKGTAKKKKSELTEFKTKLHSLPKVSSSVRIHLLCDCVRLKF